MLALTIDADPISLALRLINQFDLHGDGAAVDLRPLAELFVPVYDEVGHINLAVPPDDREVVTVQKPARTILSRRDPIPEHVRYAHEIGHILCRHQGSLGLLEVDGWFSDKQENEARTMSAFLTLPVTFLVERTWSGWTKSDLAAGAFVPEWLIDFYPG